MKPLLDKLYADTRFRYLFIGGATFAIELAILFAAQAAHIPGTIAVAVSFIIGTGISFLLQKVITFRDNRFHRKIVISQAILYLALVVFNFTFTVVAVWLLERYLPVPLIRTIALAVTVVWNYYLYRSRIFNKNDHT